MEGSSERSEDIKGGTFEDGGVDNGGQMRRFVDLIEAESSSSSGSSASEEATAAVDEEQIQRISEASSSSPNSMSWPLQVRPDSEPPDCSSDNGAEDDHEEKSHFRDDAELDKRRSTISVSGALSVPFREPLCLVSDCLWRLLIRLTWP